MVIIKAKNGKYDGPSTTSGQRGTAPSLNKKPRLPFRETGSYSQSLHGSLHCWLWMKCYLFKESRYLLQLFEKIHPISKMSRNFRTKDGGNRDEKQGVGGWSLTIDEAIWIELQFMA